MIYDFAELALHYVGLAGRSARIQVRAASPGIRIVASGQQKERTQLTNRCNDELGIREVIEHCVLLCGQTRDGRWLMKEASVRERDLHAVHHKRPGA